MTPQQEAALENLNQKIRLLDQRLQRFADAMANRTTRRNKGITRTDDPENDAADLSAWKAAMNRIEEVTDEVEDLLRDAGILPEK